MAYKLVAVSDGDDVWGRTRVKQYQLQPAVSDYVSGGYLIQGIKNDTETTGNVGIEKVQWVIPLGGQGGFDPVFNPATSKLQVFQTGAASAASSELATSTDLSAYTFLLLVAGY